MLPSKWNLIHVILCLIIFFKFSVPVISENTKKVVVRNGLYVATATTPPVLISLFGKSAGGFLVFRTE